MKRWFVLLTVLLALAGCVSVAPDAAPSATNMPAPATASTGASCGSPTARPRRSGANLW